MTSAGRTVVTWLLVLGGCVVGVGTVAPVGRPGSKDEFAKPSLLPIIMPTELPSRRASPPTRMHR